jgi:type IV pilus assembly protein PilN
MRISINLATRPFVELGPLFARLRLAMAGLALLAVVLGITLHSMNKRAAAAEAQMDALKQQTAALESERLSNEARMRQPQNKAVLDRSRFLNTLFASKSFSWTAVMMDLERVLPGGVQVTSIEPAVSADGSVSIHLRVNGPRDLAVELVRNLERSQRFAQPRLSNETAQTEEAGRVVTASQSLVPGAVEFDILSGYNPLPLEMKSAAPKAATASGAAKAAGSGKARAGGPGSSRKSAKPAVPAAKKPAVPGVVH